MDSSISSGSSRSPSISSGGSISNSSELTRITPGSGLSVSGTSGKTPMFSSPAKFPLKPGQFLHDVECNETLNSFTRRLCAMDVYSAFFDYSSILEKDDRQNVETCEAHEKLNRFSDVRCFEDNRVKVPSPKGDHDYIHANYVDGFREHRKFILTQAPLEATVEQFWTMIYQEKVVEIVSLMVLDTTLCNIYIPTKFGGTVSYGPYTIEHCGTQQVRETYDATILKLKKGNEQPRKVLHILYFAWPDKGTPTKPTEMLYMNVDMNFNKKLLVEEAEKSGWLKPGETSPIVLHCLTGAGRSGTLAALDICCRKLDYTEKLPSGPVVDVKDTVLRLRTQREMAVQKPEQYLFLHLAVIEYALRQRYYDDIEFIDFSNFSA